jgi:hypothetical protein
MINFIQICLADIDTNVLATLSVGIIVALVCSRVHEYRKERRRRRRLERKRQMPVR